MRPIAFGLMLEISSGSSVGNRLLNITRKQKKKRMRMRKTTAMDRKIYQHLLEVSRESQKLGFKRERETPAIKRRSQRTRGCESV